MTADRDETTERLPTEAEALAISSPGWALYANGAPATTHHRTGQGAAQLPTAKELADTATNTAMFDRMRQAAALRRGPGPDPDALCVAGQRASQLHSECN